MTQARVPGEPLVLAALCVASAAAAWWWRTSVVARERVVAPAQEPWERIRDAYPMPAEGEQAPRLTPEAARAVVESNPFSSERRQALQPSAHGAGAGMAAPAEPQRPQLAFKGRIRMGSKSRAIIEDLPTGKTHFLEVGQAVAEFKVLDISETQVIVSDPRSGEQVVLSVSGPAAPAR